MKPNIITEYIGSTLRATLVCSGATITNAFSCLRDRENAIVTSLAATSSGNGHMFADLPLPNTPQWMVNEWGVVLNTNTYRRFALVNVRGLEVD